MSRYFLFLLLSLTSILFADTDDDIRAHFPNTSLADSDSLSKSIIDGKVSVITGNYIENAMDLVIDGPEPLCLTRFHSNDGRLGAIWDYGFPLPAQVKESKYISRGGKKGPGFRINLRGASGGAYLHEGFSRKKDGTIQSWLRTKPQTGFTNCGCGKPSGKSNPLNSWIHFIPEYKQFVYQDGGCNKRRYEKASEDKYLLDAEYLSNGCRFFYDYSNRKIKNIESYTGRFPNCYAKLSFENKEYKTLVKGSNGDEVLYKFNKGVLVDDGNFFNGKRLVEVIRTHGFNTYYDYDVDSNSVLKMSLKRIGSSKNTNNYLLVNYCDDRKVSSLVNPFGEMYRFNYKQPSSFDGFGETHVYDAAGRKTSYFYHFPTKRLEQIIHFDGDNVVLKEEIKWDDNSSLRSKEELDGSGQLLRKKFFNYDERYNITEETLEGDLLGWSGRDYFTRWYRYSNDGFNNLLAEGDAENPTIEYEYKPNSDINTARFVCNGDRIELRQFKILNDNNFCYIEIFDNGSTRDPYNLTDVSERLIIKRMPGEDSATFFRPVVETVYYLDQETGIEKHLKTVTYEYDSKGRQVKESMFDADLAYCYTLERRYDNHNNIIWECDALGHITERTFDVFGNLLTENGVDKRFITENTYDAIGRHLSQSHREGSGFVLTSRNNYNQLNQITSHMDGLGRTSHFKYDRLGHCIEKLNPATITGFDENILTLNASWSEYNPLGHQTLVRSNDGGVVTQKYTSRGDVKEKIYDDGTFEKWIYSNAGRLVCKRSRANVTTVYAYDRLGNIIREEIIDDYGNSFGVTTHVWRGKRLLQTTDALGNVHCFKYDGAGRKIEEQIGNKTTKYAYDSLGRCCEVSIGEAGDAKPLVMDYKRYDFANRVIEEGSTSGEGSLIKKVQYSYDPIGNRIATIHWSSEQDSAISFTDYDTLKRPVRVIDPNGEITHIVYYIETDPVSQALVWVKATTDPMGRIIIERMDALDRLRDETIHDALGILLSKKIYTYDLGGRRSKCTVATIENGTEKGSQIYLWKYNKNGDLIEEITAWNTPEQRIISHEYVLGGLKAKKVKANGNTLHFQYDTKTRLKSISDSLSTISYTYEYDLLDRVVEIKDTLHNKVIRKRYDTNDNLVHEAFDEDLSLKYTQNALGKLTSIGYPDGSRAEYKYESLYLKSVVRISSEGNVQYRYTVDERNLYGDPMAVTLPGNVGKLCYTYDKEGRTQEIHTRHFEQIIEKRDKEYKPLKIQNRCQTKLWSDDLGYDSHGNLNVENSFRYSYDSLGNRIIHNGQSISYNSQNQETTYSYDENGNLISDGKNSYQYDGFNRLIRVQTKTDDVEYIYDDSHRRLEKRVNGVSERYAYVGDKEIGTYTSEGFNHFRLLAGGLGAEIGATIAIEHGSHTFVPIHDHRGGIVSLIDAETDKPAAQFKVSGFGEQLENSDSENHCPWRFLGKRVDPETGFVYFGLRYYNPAHGRWTTLDPEGFDEHPNGYIYVNNRPHSQLDLYGNFSIYITGPVFTSPIQSAGMGHGVVNYYVDAVHDLQLGLAYMGCVGLDMTYDERCGMYSSIRQSQDMRNETINNAIMDFYGVDESNEIYQRSRFSSKQSLEIASIVSGVCGIAMGITKLSKLHKTPILSMLLPENITKEALDEFRKFRRYWENKAPKQAEPYSTYRRYTFNGDIKQVSTYDEFGNIHRQYDLIDPRHVEHYHKVIYDEEFLRPCGCRIPDHFPIVD